MPSSLEEVGGSYEDRYNIRSHEGLTLESPSAKNIDFPPEG